MAFNYRTAELAATLYAALASPTTSDAAQSHYAIEVGNVLRDNLRAMINARLNHVWDDAAPKNGDDVTVRLAAESPIVGRVLRDSGITGNRAPVQIRFWVTRTTVLQSFDCWDGERRFFTLLDVEA